MGGVVVVKILVMDFYWVEVDEFYVLCRKMILVKYLEICKLFGFDLVVFF